MTLIIKNYHFRDVIYGWLVDEGKITPTRVEVVDSNTIAVKNCNSSELVRIGSQVTKITDNQWEMEIVGDNTDTPSSEEE
jgi:hypothetical protein